MLSERQKKIITFILKYPQGINASSISNEVGVSPRTIRNDIASINMYLMNNHCMINSSKRVGYFIVDDNVERVKDCLILMNAIDDKQIASSPMERKYYVLGQLMQNNHMDLYTAAQELYVSEQTIYKDIASFQKELKRKYHFTCLHLENGSLVLHVEEEELRALFYRIVKEEIYLSNKLMDINLYQLVKDIVDMDEVHNIVDYISGYCRANEINIPDQMLFIITWMVFFTIIRVEQGNVIHGEIPLHHNNESLHKMLSILVKDLHLELDVEDMALLQNYMETLGLFSKQNSALIGDENEEIAQEFIHQMLVKYNLDFKTMPSLFQNFKTHLEFAVKRLLMDYQLLNPLLQEVKTKYSFAYEIAMLIVPIVHKKYKLYMKEDEISFLALYIQPFLKVQNTSVRTLLVYGTSQSFTHLIKTWLYQEFKERIHVLGYIPLYQLDEEIKSRDVDLIISSTAIEKKVDIPVISIMQLPMEADRIQIENFISRQAMLSQSVSVFRSIFSEKRVLCIDEEITYEEILKRCAKNLVVEGKILEDEKFVETIISREEVYPTYIDNGCYMPHPLMNSALQSAISMAIIKTPCDYKGNRVKVLFVSAFEPKIDADLKYVYNLIHMIATTQNLVDIIVNMEEPSEIMSYLERIIQIMKD